jgi:hypothetical protein
MFIFKKIWGRLTLRGDALGRPLAAARFAEGSSASAKGKAGPAGPDRVRAGCCGAGGGVLLWDQTASDHIPTSAGDCSAGPQAVGLPVTRKWLVISNNNGEI